MNNLIAIRKPCYIRQIMLSVLASMLMVGCTPEPTADIFLVTLVVDGLERTFQLTESYTVEEFLRQQDVNITIGETDRITPPRFTQLSDGMRITIVRVSEETQCLQEAIPYAQEIVLNEGMRPDEQRLGQVGQDGLQEICYRIISENGIERERIRTGQATIIREPVNEIIIVGLQAEVEPVVIPGTLAYINNQNAWFMKGNSTSKQPLTTTSDLDGLVLSLSPDGRYLLYTTKPSDETAFVNALWLIETTANSSPVQLVPTDVLYAEWVTSAETTISYSTSEVQDLFPYWRALNNVWTMRLDPQSGEALNVRQIVAESGGGLSGWWGTVFKWSPDGTTLGWVRADSAGIVDPEGELIPLLRYAPFRTSQPWSWRANLSWNWDGTLLVTTTHGAPLGSEPADTSPVFNVTVADMSGSFSADVVTAAGMWSAPRFSPSPVDPAGAMPQGYIAFLQAREPYNSVSGEYNLIVADRDGSNARVVFPRQGQPGIQSSLVGITSRDFVWGPNGKSIALIYRGNLWVVDVETLVSHQLTFDGQSQYPVWSR